MSFTTVLAEVVASRESHRGANMIGDKSIPQLCPVHSSGGIQPQAFDCADPPAFFYTITGDCALRMVIDSNLSYCTIPRQSAIVPDDHVRLQPVFSQRLCIMKC